MIEIDKKFLRITAEIIVLILGVSLINHSFFPENPGFLTGSFNPYAAIAIITAAYYGKFFGFTALFISCAAMAIPLRDSTIQWSDISIRLTILIIGIYLLGMIRDSYRTRIVRYQKITRKEISEKHKFKTESEALSEVNRELEERVLRQPEAVTSLYTQIKALHTQNLSETLNILLRTVNKFTQAQKASIWRYDETEERLIMIANSGWQAEDFENSIIDIEDSIEGWAFRNNMVFSVRMLLQYDNLLKMDRKRNILTLPINFSGRTWGLLNIEEMPFTKYNLYVEQIMSILIDLASPEIEKAVEYDQMITYNEINPYTGLTSYTQFSSMIDRYVEKGYDGKSSFSIVLIEILNFNDLQAEYGDAKIWKLLITLMEKLAGLSGHKIDFYHYKETDQLALYYPDIDYDGVSMFCLETLGIINDRNWKIDDREINIEAVLGYSSFGLQKFSATEMFETAENLLQMQKV
jgi:GGDEF domain-containing protein